MSSLLPFHLFPQAWETFKRRPWLVMGMSFVYGVSRNWMPNGPLLVFGLLLLLLAGPIRGGYDMAMLRLEIEVLPSVDTEKPPPAIITS